jgi:hypothetical protein
MKAYCIESLAVRPLALQSRGFVVYAIHRGLRRVEAISSELGLAVIYSETPAPPPEEMKERN